MPLTTTIQTILDRSVDTTGYNLYMVKNHSDVIYVGQSTDIQKRIQAHIDKAEEPWGPILGKVIKDFLPDSKNWEVEIYTVNECSDLIKLYFPRAFIRQSKLIDYAEDALIHHYNPQCNRKTNIGYGVDSAFTSRLRKEKEEKEARIEAEAAKKREFLVNSVCDICGEHDTWVDTRDNLPCGVRENVFGFSLLCHSCHEVIGLIEQLKRKGDRVEKVQKALESLKI